MKRTLFAAACAAFIAATLIACGTTSTPTTPASGQVTVVDPLVAAGLTVPAGAQSAISHPDYTYTYQWSACTGPCVSQAFHAIDARDGSGVHYPYVYAIWNYPSGLAGGRADVNGNITLSIPPGLQTIWILANAYYFNTNPFTIFCLYNNPSVPITHPVTNFTMTVCS